MKLYAIIPAYNEERHIQEVAERAKKQLSNESIIVVDDGSKDKTYEHAKQTGITAIRHVTNLGKGAALKTGAEYAISKGADALIFIDSDLQHMPEDIPSFAKAIGTTDIAFGYREPNSQMPAVLKFGNWFIGKAIKTLFGMNIKDTQCGYRAMTAQAYRQIKWTSPDYSVESEMIALAGKHKLKYAQVPIETIYIDKYKGTTVMDGISIVMKMLWWKITR
ncbi:glycosyltransferase family 2 protein [Candidatus Woesearchaeota archaeon]|nr:glycosyltransferase family 2 protein [Candidatus Woesearchaeota archaeon]